MIGGFFFLAYFPGFLAYQEQKKRQASFPFIKTIHASLKTYSDNQPNNLFPEEIKSYKILRQLVIETGKSIPEDQADTKIDYLKYETSDRKNYILRLNIEDNVNHFYILYPDGIIETSIHDQIDDKAVMELIRTLLYMDRAILSRNISLCSKYYTSSASISITHNSYQGRPIDKNKKNINLTSYKEFTSYINSLEDFYSNTSAKHRKRDEIYIARNGTNWEVHSNYIEEGTFRGKMYIKDGRTMYTIMLSKKPNYIVGDKSFASIYFF